MIDYNNYSYYAIIDLEATCCTDASIPNKEREIIEIGAAMLDSNNLRIIDTFSTTVKPVRHPKLTSFCTKLTGIEQEEVDNAPSFSEAMMDLEGWLSSYPEYLFCSWGNFDKHQFMQDCKYHDIPYPFGDNHFNIKSKFAVNQNVKSKGVEKALRSVGLRFEGQPHRGLDDAINMAQLAAYIFV